MMFMSSEIFSFNSLTAWITTFILHSSSLVLAAWIFAKFLAPQRHQLQEYAWKTALVMGLFTTSLQWGLHFNPLSLIPASETTAISGPSEKEPLSEAMVPFSLTQQAPVPGDSSSMTEVVPIATSPAEKTSSGFPWQKFLVLSWLAGSLVFLLRFCANLIRLHRILIHRKPLTAGPLFERLKNIKSSANFKRRVRLSTSDHIQIPIAFGLIRPEICVPRQALTELKPGQQATMLAHELAHLIHRDPHWLRLVHLMQAVLFFQPLLRIAQQQLDHLSEMRCDDWAVQNLGQPRDLARCLTEVAGWSLNTKCHLPVPGMAKGGSILERRVERLLNKNSRVIQSQSWIFRVMIIGGLGLMAMATPGMLPAEPVIAPAPEAQPEVLTQASDLSQPQPAIVPAIATLKASDPSAEASPTPAIAATTLKPAGKTYFARGQKASPGRWDDYNRKNQHKEIRELVIEAPKTLLVDGGTNGGISVKGWDRSDVKIVAKVQVYAEDDEDPEAIFSEIQVIADDRIYAEGPDRQSWGVSFEIYAPYETDVNLETHNGGISLRDLSGTLRFKALNGGISLKRIRGDVRGQTTNGGLKVVLDGQSWEGKGLDVKTTNGGIQLEVPEGFNAQLHTGTVNGRMNFDFPIMVQGQVNKNFKTTLGKGGPAIRVMTTNGSVNVSR